MPPPKVIVFGPTGGIGLPTALAAQKQGAKVYLAMRDPTKPIKGLSPSAEVAGNFSRVQADLADASSIESAVRQTGAKHAFLYFIMENGPDKARASVAALKDAGIEYVVFLSSASVVAEDLGNISPEEFASYTHAQVEIAIEEAFGRGGFAAVRPAYFASNIFWWRKMVGEGEVVASSPGVEFDYIVPGDIGRVCGLILAKGPSVFDGVIKKSPVYLRGPREVSLTEAIGTLGEVLGREIKIKEVGLEEGIKAMVEGGGLPEFAARPLLTMIDRKAKGGEYVGPSWCQGVGNVELYTGRKSTELREYLEGVKGEF